MSGVFIPTPAARTPDSFTGPASEAFVRASVLALHTIGARVSAAEILGRIRKDNPNHSITLLREELRRAILVVTVRHRNDCCLIGNIGDFATVQIEKIA